MADLSFSGLLAQIANGFAPIMAFFSTLYNSIVSWFCTVPGQIVSAILLPIISGTMIFDVVWGLMSAVWQALSNLSFSSPGSMYAGHEGFSTLIIWDIIDVNMISASLATIATVTLGSLVYRFAKSWVPTDGS
jgi:hypothetical protein